ncbi:MAG TPA: division/cell wall cluster transcriptional repressor MraZ [candidate division WWE3 bacterium]|uniref:Transcriptional regulator MraZ n=1 Tax=candidate division WWE3 bacterium TaxID=2053526 RepID=A0A7C1NMX5_UNCKA|nr:division/cell wall cluster transcriptional repressor MraZ [candidate division WWE3 bacterium]
MLIGEYRVRVGAKNRVALPKKLREDLADNVVAMRGYEGALLLVSKGSWASLIEEVLNGPLTDPKVRDTARFLMGGAHEIEFDSQGRFVLPQPLVEHSGVKPGEEVVFVGLGKWVELWSAERWNKRLEQLGEEASGSLKL